MTRTEALMALLGGQMIKHPLSKGRCGIRFNPEEGFEFEREDGSWMIATCFNLGHHTYELYNQNPFKPGTFDWAEFEYKSGKSVGRPNRCQYTPCGGGKWKFRKFTPEDFRATDWDAS